MNYREGYDHIYYHHFTASFIENHLRFHAEHLGSWLNYREGYDHSYYHHFISSFIENHLRFHAEHLSR
ncbi:hypothetical protein [Shewanella atlantica]|uniref:hypothetical protein n=1 Tax=Shewanella atlantica TaxID=271099 RepID=UPI0037364F19